MKEPREYEVYVKAGKYVTVWADNEEDAAELSFDVFLDEISIQDLEIDEVNAV